MATEKKIAAGLFDWINSLEVADGVTSADQLSDGLVIWRVLR